jgi:hypothetical protein
MTKDPLAELEDATYFARFDDGLLDLFIGVSLLWIGAAWLWFEDLAAFAGLLPALLATSFATWRGRFLRARGGYVRFSEARRGWERRNMVVFLGVGTAVAGLILLLLAVDRGPGRDAARWLAPGLIALIVAALVGLLAAVSRLPRLAWYTLLLVLGGIGGAALATNPGAPLLLAGLVITGWAAVLVSRYLRAHSTEGTF